jgi:hypothetical protein
MDWPVWQMITNLVLIGLVKMWLREIMILSLSGPLVAVVTELTNGALTHWTSAEILAIYFAIYFASVVTEPMDN